MNGSSSLEKNNELNEKHWENERERERERERCPMLCKLLLNCQHGEKGGGGGGREGMIGRWLGGLFANNYSFFPPS